MSDKLPPEGWELCDGWMVATMKVANENAAVADRMQTERDAAQARIVEIEKAVADLTAERLALRNEIEAKDAHLNAARVALARKDNP